MRRKLAVLLLSLFQSVAALLFHTTCYQRDELSYVYVYLSIALSLYIYIHMYVYLYVYMYIYNVLMYVYRHTHVYMHMCEYTEICMYLYGVVYFASTTAAVHKAVGDNSHFISVIPNGFGQPSTAAATTAATTRSKHWFLPTGFGHSNSNNNKSNNNSSIKLNPIQFHNQLC